MQNTMKSSRKLLCAALVIAATGLSATSNAGQLIITTKHGESQLADRLIADFPTLTVKRQMLDARRWVINVPDGDAKLNNLITRLQELPFVDYVENDIRVYASLVPNDTYYSQQWALFEDAAGINAQAAQDITTGSGAVIAVVDTGYIDHPDLDANRLPGYDMISTANTARDGDGRDDDARDEGDYSTYWMCGYASDSSWHGSHVAGIAAAINDNATGISGVAPGAKFVPVRALGACGGYLSDIADAVIWASGAAVSGTTANNNPADVINLSLGGAGTCSTYMQDAVNEAVNAGAVVVVAAGNENVNASGSTPANCNNVITVAAVGRDGARASYSNYGDIVDIAAPGGSGNYGILSTIDSGTRASTGATYAEYQGTSMATPHVAGVVALMRSANPNATVTEITDALQATARAFPGTCSGCGAGIVDAEAAVNYVSGGTTPVETWETVSYRTSGVTVLADARSTPRRNIDGVTNVNITTNNDGQNIELVVIIDHPNHSELSVVAQTPDNTQMALTRMGQNGTTAVYRMTSATASAGIWTLTVIDSVAGNRGAMIRATLQQEELQ
ncbi:S8 family serine peptidase [Thalassolituus oleivorans]|uniref:S8 family serine peptidase n=1 Tax=Thalassolituus oleivorans TaxID=187493 RepID=UPI001B7BF6C2|nr:S8 family serine peptidase [Thalassolituus oleivorans]MBQ0726697.1 S8 family serine peptidase [Thalassolituus oleivorans]MBQ0779666.1 S8 family serine peptidase [Thalassolituus oleivorans]